MSEKKIVWDTIQFYPNMSGIQFSVFFPNIMSGENHIARIATPVSPVDKQVKIISVFHLSPNIFMLNPIIY